MAASIQFRWKRFRRTVTYMLSPRTFAVVAFLIIDLVLTIYLSYQTVLEDTVPTPGVVEIPPDFALPLEEITFPGGMA